MLESLFGSDTFCGIVDEYLPQEIKEVSAEFVVLWDNFLGDVSIGLNNRSL